MHNYKHFMLGLCSNRTVKWQCVMLSTGLTLYLKSVQYMLFIMFIFINNERGYFHCMKNLIKSSSKTAY